MYNLCCEVPRACERMKFEFFDLIDEINNVIHFVICKLVWHWLLRFYALQIFHGVLCYAEMKLGCTNLVTIY